MLPLKSGPRAGQRSGHWNVAKATHGAVETHSSKIQHRTVLSNYEKEMKKELLEFALNFSNC